MCCDPESLVATPPYSWVGQQLSWVQQQPAHEAERLWTLRHSTHLAAGAEAGLRLVHKRSGEAQHCQAAVEELILLSEAPGRAVKFTVGAV